jgi:hypothetical protein
MQGMWSALRPMGMNTLRSAAKYAGLAAGSALLTLAPPHLWFVTDDLVVTVAGDATREELVRIAESL